MTGRGVLAVMAKAPRAGLVKTRLCPPLSPDEAAELARAFLLDAVDQVRSVAAARPAMAYAPVDARAFFHALAPDFALVAQRGDDLGARLSHAFEDLLADGAPGAIVIGSDVPTLPSAVLAAALDRLAGADLVLGPSEDGGYYLIGLREPRAGALRGHGVEHRRWSSRRRCAGRARSASTSDSCRRGSTSTPRPTSSASRHRWRLPGRAPGTRAASSRSGGRRSGRDAGGRRASSEARERTAHWKRWGPYVSERQWGTVREDYSRDGTAWEYLPHDHARSRAYRWGEDGIAGISDNHQRLCFAWAFWNGRDPILKERLFGLSGPQGNHGEDVKECYFYLDSTPTHSYMKYLYKYPQAAFPYEDLVEENRRRGRGAPEYELLDTGVFDEDRYWDILIEYAKAGVNDILIRVTATNRGPEAAVLDLLPTLWFRNTWSWDRGAPRPTLSAWARAAVIEADHDIARHALAGRRGLARSPVHRQRHELRAALGRAERVPLREGRDRRPRRARESGARQPRAHRHQGRAPLSADARARRVERHQAPARQCAAARQSARRRLRCPLRPPPEPRPTRSTRRSFPTPCPTTASS